MHAIQKLPSQKQVLNDRRQLSLTHFSIQNKFSELLVQFVCED